MWPTLDPPRRHRRTELRLSFLREASPNYLGQHPIDSRGPSECVNGMVTRGRCALWDLFWDVPEHLETVINDADAELRAYFALLTRLASADGRGDADVYLKSPYHSLWMNSLLKADSRLRVVYIERDLVTACASWVSLLVAAQQGLIHDVDVSALGSSWVKRWKAALEALDLVPSERKLVVRFDDLQSEPTRVAWNIAEWAGVGRASLIQAKIEQESWLLAHPRIDANPPGRSPYESIVESALAAK